jgi:AI-2 transport protein TqsA
MSGDHAVRTMFGLWTAIFVVTALYFTSSIFAPIAFSLFIMAIVWPLQKTLQARLPKLAALAVTILVTLGVIAVLASLIVWGFGKVGQWLIGNAGRFQSLYKQMSDWFEGHGIFIAALAVEHFNIGWLLRIFNGIAGRIQNLVTFATITSVFTILGLLEINAVRHNLTALNREGGALDLSRLGAEIAAKFQKYMVVRSLMSVMTGLVIWIFALFAGLELATAWGVIAFVLNYIPFLGPLIATIFPALFAIAQTESWQTGVTVFLCLNAIQFLSGSYIEPRIAGSALSVSPFMVLFAVFFWSFIWGIPGAFIGVPILIALITICGRYPASRWIAVVLSGREETPGPV